MQDGSDKLANIMLQRDIDDSMGAWDMYHRIVKTGDLRITGTEFLHLTERYLQVADDVLVQAHEDQEILRKTDVKHIYVESHQPKVTDWLLKNGYHFERSQDEELYKNYLENPGHYELTKVDFGDDIGDRDLFLFKRAEEVNNKDDLEQDIPQVSLTFRELHTRPDVVKLKLIKDL